MKSQQQIQRIEELVRKIETTADPDMRASAVELMQSLMELHGAGIERMMEIVAQAGTPGDDIINNFANDALIASLLLLYGQHPLTLETRVRQALEKLRPVLRSHGGSVELLGMDDGVVRLRLEGSGKSCGSSSLAALRLAIEEAIYEAAPDVAAIEAEAVAAPPAASGFVLIGRKVTSYG